MAATGFTPISLYYSTTTTNTPTSGNLVNGELAINITDGKLFYKDNANVVQTIATKAGANGDVVGPASATADNLVLFDGTTGKLIKQTTTGTGVVTALGNSTNSTGGLVTADGTATLTNKTLTDPAIIGTVLEDIFTITDGAAFEVDPSNGSIQLITLGASRTPKATNFAAGESITLMVDDGSAYTLTWTDATWGSGGVVWETNGGVAPTLATSGYTVIVFWKVGSQVYGARVGDA